MTSPEFQELLRTQRAIGDQSEVPLEALREASERKGASFPIPADVTLTPVSFEGLAVNDVAANDIAVKNVAVNKIAAEWSQTPGVSPDHVLMFFHGGGYYRGSIAGARELTVRMAREGGMRGFSVGYRLAPEHRFPAPVEDALGAYRWLLAEGFEPGRIALAGASAGGGLALALLLAARKEGLPLPGAAVLLSPWVDLTQSGPTFATHAAADPLIGKPYLDRFANLYLEDADPTHPLASPLFGEMAGLPPLLIQVGGAETMLDQSERLAAKARKAGVDAAVEVWPEMTHVWQGNGPGIPEARQAVGKAGAWLREKMGL